MAEGRAGGVRLRVALGVLALAAVAASCGLGPIAPRAVETPDLDRGATLESMPVEVGEKPGDVALHFAWPAPAEGRCASVARRVETKGTQTLRVTFGIRVTPDGDQLRVETFDYALPPEAPHDVEPLVEPWGAERLVDRQGRLLGVQLLDTGLSSAERTVATARVTQQWQAVVGVWAGRTLPVGVTYSATAPEPSLEGPVRLQLAIRVDGRLPCRAGGATNDCVRMRVLSQPTAGDAAIVARLAARELLPPDEFALYEPSRVKAFAAQNDLVLVTDPDTLLPRRWTERRALRLRIDPLVGPSGTDVDRQDELTTACVWSAT